MDRKDVLAFWFGEPDEVTPDFIRSAASESLLRGETFYSHNLGLPELRSTVATTFLRCMPTRQQPSRQSMSPLPVPGSTPCRSPPSASSTLATAWSA
jgi:aspartate/methionine/tyrosine aminotransferase